MADVFEPWHAHRESVFAIMREIDQLAIVHLERARYLEAGPGLPVGGAAFDERLVTETLVEFLCGLRKGTDPAGAATLAMAWSRTVVRNWNKNPRCVTFSGKHEVQRWEETCGALIEDMVRRFRGVVPEMEI